MSGEIWNLFPYPTLTDSGCIDGSILEAHVDCEKCPTRACLKDTSASIGELRQCRYGITYARIDNDRLLTGVVSTDLVHTTGRAKGRARREPERRVRAAALERAIESARELGVGVVNDYDVSKREVLAKLERDPQMHTALAEQISRDFSDNLNQSHDFLQLVKLVRGHAESLLHERFPDLSVVDAADQLPTEGAIYYSTELMLAKMDSMVFLNEINQAHGHESRFQLHPMVIKYVRIYDWQAREKELRISVEGDCYAFCRYNTKAIGAVVQGLLDNLVKYAPSGSKSALIFKEHEGEATLKFVSLGPKIEPSEMQRIFLPKFRAAAARAVELSGLGVGLATAKQISDALDLGLTVSQEHEPDPRFPERYATQFEFRVDTVT